MKRTAKIIFAVEAILLACIDYTAIQIELCDFAQQVAATNAFPFAALFPNGSTFMPSMIWFALLVLRIKAPAEKQGKPLMDWAFALLFAGCTVVLHSIWIEHNLSFLLSGPKTVALAVFSVLGLSSFWINLLKWLRCLCKKYGDWQYELPVWWKRHPFLFPFSIIFVLWLPLLIFKYPGTAEYDAYGQLLKFLGYGQITNHWPVSSGALFYLCFTAGKALLGTNNAGFFTLTVCLSLFCAACLAYSLKTMYRMKIKHQHILFTLILYAVFTIFSRYCTSLNKDCVYACVLLVCVCYCAEWLFGDSSFKFSQFLIFTMLSFLMGIFRSNGPHTILLWAVMFLIIWIAKRERKLIKLFASLMSAFLLCQCYLNVLLPALNIPGSFSGEALSIPLMQTARYVRDHADEVTEEEKEAISAVLNYDALAKIYNDRLSDSVKATYHANDETFGQYAKVWFQQGLKHPETYVLATLNNICGFFYPGAKESATGIYTTDNPTWSIRLAELSEEQDLQRTARMERLEEAILAFENFPLFYPFCNAAVQTWVMLYMAFSALWKKKGRCLLLLTPSLVTLLVCIAGPTFVHNGIRYALPIIFLNPFLFSLYLQKMATGLTQKDYGQRKGQRKKGTEHSRCFAEGSVIQTDHPAGIR